MYTNDIFTLDFHHNTVYREENALVGGSKRGTIIDKIKKSKNVNSLFHAARFFTWNRLFKFFDFIDYHASFRAPDLDIGKKREKTGYRW